MKKLSLLTILAAFLMGPTAIAVTKADCGNETINNMEPHSKTKFKKTAKKDRREKVKKTLNADD